MEKVHKHLVDGKKIKNIINRVFAILVCLMLVAFSILVGSPLRENTRNLTYIVIIIFCIYVVQYKLILRNKYVDIFKSINVIDICILILCVSPFIPILFKTSVNLQDSLNVGIRYVTVLMLYILSKLILIQDNKYKKYFCNGIIITGIISAIIGIDNLTTGHFSEILNKMGLPRYANSENRMFGNFGYANTFAMSLVIPLVLSVDRYINKEKRNLIYIVINSLFLTCILLSYSRATGFVMFIAFIIYCILQKNLQKSLKLINSLIIAMLFGIIYTKIFADNYYTNNYTVLLGVLIGFTLTCTIFTILVDKLMQKINIKKYVIFMITILILAIITLIIGLNLNKPLELFKDVSKTKEVIYQINNAIPEKEYTFEFDIEANSKNDREIYFIQVIERDFQNNPILNHETRIGTYLGKKTVKFKASSEIVSFWIIFKSLKPAYQEGLKINNLKINGEEYPLDYKYLPAKFVNRMQSLEINGLLNHGRTVFYKDAFKLIKQNPWTGIGGNGWNYKYDEVSTYDYHTSQVHSYPVQIFLEFGIVAIIAYLVMLVFICKNAIKMNKEEYGILIALFAIIAHSAIDFDLSFLNMLLYTFVLISMVVSDEKKEVK